MKRFRLDRLAESETLRASIESDISRQVAILRGEGATWAEIGAALRLTRQGAWSRYRHHGQTGQT